MSEWFKGTSQSRHSRANADSPTLKQIMSVAPCKYQVDLAIKARAAASWEADDARAVRLEYLRRSFGGESGESPDNCVWAGCSKRALRSIAMCADHAYDRAGVRAKEPDLQPFGPLYQPPAVRCPMCPAPLEY